MAFSLQNGRKGKLCSHRVSIPSLAVHRQCLCCSTRCDFIHGRKALTCSAPAASPNEPLGRAANTGNNWQSKEELKVSEL